MNREDTKKCIEVMQHYVDGGEIKCEGLPNANPFWIWANRNDSYTIAKPAPNKVKLLAYLNSIGVLTLVEPNPLKDWPSSWRRVPSEDKEVEVVK